MNPERLNKYYERIQVDEKILNTKENSYEKIKMIQENHCKNIPFENTQVLFSGAKIPISTDFDYIFYKLVELKRGGYCFEQNTLIAAALETLGLEVEIKAARVILDCQKPENWEESLTHILLIVSEKNTSPTSKWLVDTGFGGFNPINPILLEDGAITATEEHTYMMCRHQLASLASPSRARATWTLEMVRANENGNFLLYEFDEMINFTKKDIELSNYYVCTHPDSFFTNTLFVSGYLPNSSELTRISLWNLTKNTRNVPQNTKTSEKIMSASVLLSTFHSLGLCLNSEHANIVFQKLQHAFELPPPPNA